AQFGTNGGSGGGGSVNSVTGLNTDNTDPTNPIVGISVDGSTITGAGTPASPLVANSNFVNSVTGLNTDNTDPLNPIVGISVDGSTITGAGTPASPLVASVSTSKLLVSYHMNNNFSPNTTQNYYFGQQSSIGSSINQAVAVPIPSGTITEVITNTYIAGSFGSSEGSTFTLWTNTNSGTPTTDVIATGVQFPTANPRNFSQSFTGLSISVVTGGSFIQVATPNWSSPPTSVQIRVSLIIEL
ncbi:hypothetical protein, partial [Winogradskyella sp.]|uniref:hypothetical protein n=1 Tax=Winogradskyella sp. TaxID=1883156 RepID=UPI003F6998EC